MRWLLLILFRKLTALKRHRIVLGIADYFKTLDTHFAASRLCATHRKSLAYIAEWWLWCVFGDLDADIESDDHIAIGAVWCIVFMQCAPIGHESFFRNNPDSSMMTSSNGNIFRVTGHLCGEFTAQKPMTRSFAVFFVLRLNKRLSKQSWGWWFETISCPLWRHRNEHK